ncbi:MAG: tyrosine-type recombinase/integrase [Candidatus Competibacteraceae bacterium]|nr:tyrosine-type recombinase/integrase [Candidatus Competibacteraceae bacterium]
MFSSRFTTGIGLQLNSGLRISEAIGLKVIDVRLVEGAATSVRVIGKGDKERLVLLPEAFGAVFRFWLERPAARGVRVRPCWGRNGWSRGWRGCERRERPMLWWASGMLLRRLVCL